MMRRLFVAALAFALVTACNRGPNESASQNTPSQSSTSTINPQGGTHERTALNPPAAMEKDNPGEAVQTAVTPSLRVELQEYQIRMEQTLPAGQQKLTLVNSGKEDHAFEIEGNGLHTQSKVLKRGDTQEMAVNLQPGTYTVYCPVKDHKGKGMEMQLTVK
jgi:uncharacterized cupredoxin-like copper-binding protein